MLSAAAVGRGRARGAIRPVIPSPKIPEFAIENNANNQGQILNTATMCVVCPDFLDSSVDKSGTDSSDPMLRLDQIRSRPASQNQGQNV